MQFISVKPLLSIIVPTFNSGKTLKKCFDSVVSQSFREFEIIVIDGGSTDTTASIVKEYSERYSFLNFISEPDNGIYDAMNKGVSNSSGEWIYFLGSDDFLINEFVLSGVLSSENMSGADFIYGSVIWGDTGLIYSGRFDRIKIAIGNICHQAIFYRRQLLTEVGLFNLRYKIFADYAVNLKIFRSNARILYVNMVIAYYSRDGASSMEYLNDPFIKEKDIETRQYLSSISVKEKLEYYYFRTPAERTKFKIRRAIYSFLYFLITFRNIRSQDIAIDYHSFPWDHSTFNG